MVAAIILYSRNILQSAFLRGVSVIGEMQINDRNENDIFNQSFVGGKVLRLPIKYNLASTTASTSNPNEGGGRLPSPSKSPFLLLLWLLPFCRWH